MTASPDREIHIIATPPARRKQRKINRRLRRLLRGVIDGQGRQCLLCGGQQNLTCHHIVHLRDGGPDVPSNLVGLCGTCHTTHHIVDRDLPLRVRLVLAAMVIFRGSPTFFRVARFLFPVLVRRGSGFHPASIEIRARTPRPSLRATPTHFAAQSGESIW